MNKDTITIAAAISGVVLLLGTALWYNEYKQTHRKLPYYKVTMYSDEFTSTDKPPAEKISNFNFIDQNGNAVTQETLGNCIYVADYIFTTCPGICKIMTRQMTRVYGEFKEEPRLKILSHTSKPEEDSTSVLQQYAQLNGAGDSKQWLFLTGNPKELQRMAYKEYGIVNPEDLKPEGSFVHTEMFVLVDKDKYIRGYYDGTDSTEVENLIVDIQSLLNEK
jgi:protein SCO1/2